MPVLKSAVEEKKETKEFKRSPSHRLSSYVNNNTRAFVYPEPNVLYREEKEAVSGQKDEQDYYPLEIIRSNDLIRITTKTPLVDDKNYIKVKIYNDRSIEISIDDDTLQKNKKYYRIIEVPKDADIETAKCTYRNGILEITFKQKKRYLHR
jgi:HSP20 family molecular chaperone IbpA